MKSVREGISSFAWHSLNSNPPQASGRSGRKRRLQFSSSQPDIDDIDSSDSCHSDISCDVISNKRNCPSTNTSHHFIPTPYTNVLAESISEFELSSESEDNGDTCCQSDFGDDDINVEDDGCHDDTSVHECNISDSQSIISVTSSPDVCTANQITTSDWLKGVVPATPDSKDTTMIKGLSSGHKNKTPRRRISFMRCGLAEQLDQLLSRQRSAKALWHHQMLQQQCCHDAPSGALGVKVINITTSHSLFIVQAHVIQEVGCERPQNGEVVTVLFDEDAMKILKLQAGSSVFICPPWESITIRGSHLVLLSTHFCLPFSPDVHHGDGSQNSIKNVVSLPFTVDEKQMESFCVNEEVFLLSLYCTCEALRVKGCGFMSFTVFLYFVTYFPCTNFIRNTFKILKAFGA